MNPLKLFQLAASEKVALQSRVDEMVRREKNLLVTLGSTSRESLDYRERLERMATEVVKLSERLGEILGIEVKTMDDAVAAVEGLVRRVDKIEAECVRGLSLERNCRSALNTIFMLAHKGEIP